MYKRLILITFLQAIFASSFASYNIKPFLNELEMRKKTENAPVTMHWILGQKRGDGFNENTFVLKNSSGTPLENWAVYYCQFPRTVRQDAAAPAKVEWLTGTLFRITPAKDSPALAPGDSLVIPFRTNRVIMKNSHRPEGAYMVSTSFSGGKPVSVPITADRMEFDQYKAANELYVRNEAVWKQDLRPIEDWDIIPAVKKVVPSEGYAEFGRRVSVQYDNRFSSEAELLKAELKDIFGIKVTGKAPFRISLEYLGEQSGPDEYYELEVGKDAVAIKASGAHGIFNGIQTLKALLKGKELPYAIRRMKIEDYPDMSYRGMMIDVARNFIPASDLKKYIEILSAYKINVLHLHFCDDEGWRLEIPGLEELTEVGSKRGHTADESENLLPAYGGGFDGSDYEYGSGHITRGEFIDLLKYAARHHIRVIPEVDMPGHSRAAIIAMKARYDKYIASDRAKAEEFLLSEASDISKYISAQNYDDNVINVALPSAYRFVDKVAGEIVKMYREAGVPLETLHVGGDEVPGGSWTGSPACAALMEREGIKDYRDLSAYFIVKVSQILRSHGLKTAGWQEITYHLDGSQKDAVIPDFGGVYCWRAIPERKEEEIPYRLAAEGFPTVICSARNLYLDLAYDEHPDERGHNWAGFVDIDKTFSLLPFDFYRSLRDGLGVPKYSSEGKLSAEKTGTNIIGIQSELFTETVRGYQWVEYYTFPKILGLCERGWNAHPFWEKLSGADEVSGFNSDLALFYRKVGQKEMPFWTLTGTNFRLAYPGVDLTDGILSVNCTIPYAEIRYTLDGSEPTVLSPLFTAPVRLDGKVFKAKSFHCGKESVTVTVEPERE